MIESGTICVSLTPFYNVGSGKYDFKKRPVLIIGTADFGDYNVLPISRITKSSNMDSDYDIQVDPSIYPNLKLSTLSYIRVHKQTVVNKATLNEISNLKSEYPILYNLILDKLEEYNTTMISYARE